MRLKELTGDGIRIFNRMSFQSRTLTRLRDPHSQLNDFIVWSYVGAAELRTGAAETVAICTSGLSRSYRMRST